MTGPDRSRSEQSVLHTRIQFCTPDQSHLHNQWLYPVPARCTRDQHQSASDIVVARHYDFNLCFRMYDLVAFFNTYLLVEEMRCALLDIIF